jgi:hypothetical protein
LIIGDGEEAVESWRDSSDVIDEDVNGRVSERGGDELLWAVRAG